MRYINQCTDRTEPVEDRSYEFAHPVFLPEHLQYGTEKGRSFSMMPPVVMPLD